MVTENRPDPDSSDPRYYGRVFTPQEMRLLRELISDNPTMNRHQLSKVYCRRIGWFRPNGELKHTMALTTMRAMERDGLIKLPPSRNRVKRRYHPITIGPETEPPPSVPATLNQARPLRLSIVTGKGEQISGLWNQYIARYHYLGYKRLVGSQIRYAVLARDYTPLAMLGFSTAAWKIKPRDSFIGWSDEQRKANLHLVIDNTRFLILPWASHLPNLGSHILKCARQQLPGHWNSRYGFEPVLIETFVETERFRGTVYKASGWIKVGKTQGRGRYDRYNKANLPKKDIWLRPLRKDWKRILTP